VHGGREPVAGADAPDSAAVRADDRARHRQAARVAGYRQLHAWWRLRGLIATISGRPAAWGGMPRTGFTTRVAER
jgi:hypothetical protein